MQVTHLRGHWAAPRSVRGTLRAGCGAARSTLWVPVWGRGPRRRSRVAVKNLSWSAAGPGCRAPGDGVGGRQDRPRFCDSLGLVAVSQHSDRAVWGSPGAGFQGSFPRGTNHTGHAVPSATSRDSPWGTALETGVVGKVKLISENEASPGDFSLTPSLLNIESCIYVNILWLPRD